MRRVVFLSRFRFSRQNCSGLKSLRGLELLWLKVSRRHLCRDINGDKCDELCRPSRGFGTLSALTRGLRPWYSMSPLLGAESCCSCRFLSRSDFRRQASIGCKSLAGRDLLRVRGSVAPSDATVRATELATEVSWKRARRQPTSFEATVGKKP